MIKQKSFDGSGERYLIESEGRSDVCHFDAVNLIMTQSIDVKTLIQWLLSRPMFRKNVYVSILYNALDVI